MALAKLTELELIALALHEDGDIHVVDHLIWGNPGLNPKLPLPRPDFNRMNEAQRAVAALAEFQGEVLNGGIGQYLFNCSNRIGTLLGAIPTLEWIEIEIEVRRAFASLDEATIADLVTAQGVWDEEKEFNDRWSGFRTWVERFDGDAFDEWFYERDAEFLRRFMQMIWRRRAELITGTAE